MINFTLNGRCLSIFFYWFDKNHWKYSLFNCDTGNTCLSIGPTKRNNIPQIKTIAMRATTHFFIDYRTNTECSVYLDRSAWVNLFYFLRFSRFVLHHEKNYSRSQANWAVYIALCFWTTQRADFNRFNRVCRSALK